MTDEEQGSICRSKRDIYKILRVESKFFNVWNGIENYLLPSFKRCSL